MRRTFRTRILSLILLAAGAGGSAQAGPTTTFDFLRLEMNARAAALGNSFLAIRNDPAILFFNPGGISTVEQPSASVGFLKFLLDVNAGHLSYVRQVEDIGWFGAGVVYVNYGSFERTDRSGNQLGTFGAGDLALSLTYGNVYENLHYGGSAKFIYSTIDASTATALALDAGVQYVIPSESIVLAMSVLNLGGELNPYENIRESLPFEVKVGISKKLEHLPLLLNLNFHKLNESQDNLFQHLTAFSLGGEFTLSEHLQLRLGYNNERRQELKIDDAAGLAGFSAGLGVKVSDILFDYGFASFGKIGSVHRFTIGTTF